MDVTLARILGPMNACDTYLGVVLTAVRESTDASVEPLSGRVFGFGPWMSQQDAGFLIDLIRRAKAGERPSDEELARLRASISSAYARKDRGEPRFATNHT